MAPKARTRASASHAKPQALNSDTSSPDTSQSVTQMIDMQTMQRRMDQHKQQVKQRREAQREAIMSKHKQNLENIHRDLEGCDARYLETWRGIQHPKVQHLLSLVRKKEDLEAQIEACILQVEQGFTALADQLETALAQRAEQLPT